MRPDPQTGAKLTSNGKTMGDNSSDSKADSYDKRFVIGQELADARNAEKRRQEAGGGDDSHFPETKYDFWNGDLSLISPTPNPLDDQLREFCQACIESTPELRTKIRRSITMDQFYTLINFARRSAVFGLREPGLSHVTEGLTAIALIEKERVDYRDMLVCLALLCHTGNKSDKNFDEMLRTAARLAEPDVAKLILGFTGQKPESWSLSESWGYDEIETGCGLGFIGRGFADYHPTFDITTLTVEIGKLLAKDSYMPGQIEIATGLPDVWFGGQDNVEAVRILSKVRGGATISASLHREKHTDHASQQFTVFIVETENESDARSLSQMAGSKRAPEHRSLAVAESGLFCLIIARSFVEGAEAYETKESLKRFADGLSDLLNRYSELPE